MTSIVSRAPRAIAALCLALATSSPVLAGPVLFNAERAKASAAAEAAGAKKSEYYRIVLLNCVDDTCTADVPMNSKRVTTINLVNCVVRTDGGEAEFVAFTYGGDTNDIFPIASRATKAALETAIVRTSTNVSFGGGTLTVVAGTGGTAQSGSGCLLKGTTVKK